MFDDIQFLPVLYLGEFLQIIKLFNHKIKHLSDFKRKIAATAIVFRLCLTLLLTSGLNLI